MNRSARTLLAACAFLIALADGAARAEYRLAPDFPQLPKGLHLAGVSGVATDSKGLVVVLHRGAEPVLVFEPSGKFVRSFGAGLFKSAHGLRIDRDDNVWATDNADHLVFKFDHAGKLLMTLGERGVAAEDQRHFNKPADVAFGDNGTFFVADGYGNSRVVKFDRDGKFLLAWGKKGKGQGEFVIPHAVRLDSKGQLYVADRENDRVQVFDQNGKFLRQFGGFAPFGMFITPADEMFATDGRAHHAHRLTLDGQIVETWGKRGPEPGNFFLPHGITVAADGAVYVTEVDGKRIQKFVKAP
jgi:DNA-binding beta-propeller fold protein YncE